MKIGLIDVDGHNFPNLVLMKLSAYHKSIGDEIEFADPMFGEYNKVYMSKVFTFTKDYQYYFDCDIIKGGTGYKDYETKLPYNIEHICPDYSLYGTDYAVGFTTRGCPNKCGWCVVPKKEGNITQNADIEEFLEYNKKVVLLDNNILASDWGLQQLEKCLKLGVKIDCNQGMDARLIANDKYVLDLLSHIKWIDHIRLACDTKNQLPYIEKVVYEMGQRGVKPYKFFVYTLIKEIEDSLERITKIRDLGCSPFGQPYLDFEKIDVKQWQKDMARWCNMKSILKSCDFKEYEPRKGFKCKNYFNNK